MRFAIPTRLLGFATGCAATAVPSGRSRPHIVVFLADDRGFKDVGFHGGEIENFSRPRARFGKIRA